MPIILQVWALKTCFFSGAHKKKKSLCFVTCSAHSLCCVIKQQRIESISRLKEFITQPQQQIIKAQAAGCLYSPTAAEQKWPPGEMHVSCSYFSGNPPRTLNIRTKIQTKKSQSPLWKSTYRTILFLGRWCMETAIIQAVVSCLFGAMHHHFIHSLSSTFISLFCQNSMY